jgi:hypothetical protein
MAVHVLAHLGDVVRVSTKDWSRRTRGLVAGSRARRLLITLSLFAGLVLALITVSHTGAWLRGA